MQKKFERPCPICQCISGEMLFHQRFSAMEGLKYHQTNVYDVVECSNCKFIYADVPAPVQSGKKDTSYYSQTNKYAAVNATGSGNTPWDCARFKETVSDLDAILQHNRESSIIDVGSGSGGLLIELQKQGYNRIFGTDISEKCIMNLKQHGINGCVIDFSTEEISTIISEKFNCIVLSHVMEHIHDLRKAIGNAISCLKQEGILYIEVPDAHRYKSNIFLPYHSFDLEHINHFDSVSLDNLMGEFGFKKVSFREKKVPLTKTFGIPAFYNVYRRLALENVVLPVQPSSDLSNAVREYIRLCQKINNWPALDELAASGEKVIVWGADWFASWLLANTSLGSCVIDFFVDNDKEKHGRILNGKMIHPVTDINGNDCPIIICSAFHTDSILSEIKQRAFPNRTICPVPVEG